MSQIEDAFSTAVTDGLGDAGGAVAVHVSLISPSRLFVVQW